MVSPMPQFYLRVPDYAVQLRGYQSKRQTGPAQRWRLPQSRHPLARRTRRCSPFRRLPEPRGLSLWEPSEKTWQKELSSAFVAPARKEGVPLGCARRFGHLCVVVVGTRLMARKPPCRKVDLEEEVGRGSLDARQEQGPAR